MNRKIKYLLRDFLRMILGVRTYTYIRFILTHKYIPSLRKPRSFSEKIMHRKFYVDPALFSKFVDKFTVRQYVAESIGSDYLIPLIKVREHITPSDFEDLPSSFVIKTSNGGGGENVLIVEDKSSLNLESVCKKFNEYLKINMGGIVDEGFYDIEKPQIVFETLIKHRDGRFPSDYKLHVFRGEKVRVVLQVDTDRFSTHKRSLFNTKLEKLDFDIQPKYPPVQSDYKFPRNIDKMIDIAKQLSEQFDYVRVDLYNVDGKIYFGELTFCHGSGWEPLSNRKYDYLLGSYWGIDNS